MKRSFKLWSLWGFATVSLCGTILHYLYDLSGKSVFLAPFSGVNESTWEHMKLLFFPMLIFAIIQSFFFCDRRDFFYIKLRGIVLGQLLIPVIFYTYNGVIGKSPDFINIAIFFISAATVYYYEAKTFQYSRVGCYGLFPLLLIIFIAVCFVTFTFYPPELPIFRDPVTGTYGIQ